MNLADTPYLKMSLNEMLLQDSWPSQSVLDDNPVIHYPFLYPCVVEMETAKSTRREVQGSHYSRRICRGMTVNHLID
jgi:hypothetical protein